MSEGQQIEEGHMTAKEKLMSVEDASEPREHVDATEGTITPPAGREAPMGSQEAS